MYASGNRRVRWHYLVLVSFYLLSLNHLFFYFSFIFSSVSFCYLFIKRMAHLMLPSSNRRAVWPHITYNNPPIKPLVVLYTPIYHLHFIYHIDDDADEKGLSTQISSSWQILKMKTWWCYEFDSFECFQDLFLQCFSS